MSLVESSFYLVHSSFDDDALEILRRTNGDEFPQLNLRKSPDTAIEQSYPDSIYQEEGKLTERLPVKCNFEIGTFITLECQGKSERGSEVPCTL